MDVRSRTSRRLDAFPVQQLVEVPEAEVLVLADFNDFVGVGRRAPGATLDQVWASGQVATDDARVVRVDGVVLECRGLDGIDAPFTIDARTGTRLGPTPKPTTLFPFLKRKA